jgi:hypothetical protein
LEEPFGGGSALYIGTPAMGMIKAASEPNKSYLIDCTWVTLNLNEASSAVTDWSKYTDSGITKVKVIGTWSDSKAPTFTESNVTEVDLSAVVGMSNMPYKMFYKCEKLKSVKMPSTVKNISNLAFYGCSGLTSIEIPTSVTTIGEGSFFGSGLTSLIIPSSVTSIGGNAFSSCMSLNYFYSKSSASITSFCFLSCSSTLNTIILSSNTRVTIEEYNYLPSAAYLYVPKALQAEYKENELRGIPTDHVLTIEDDLPEEYKSLISE